MLYCYLFEAKSIQSYLFKTGKLKDVIAASERLDLLVDDTSNSVLANVMAQLNDQFSHDLDGVDNQKDIQFLRCKGGAFYAFSENEAPLKALRNLWTLTVQQLFPSLEFCDALVSGSSLQTAMKTGHQQLAADRNQAKIKFPLAPAIANISQRTGHAEVPASLNAKKAGIEKDERVDLDTELHRQAYTLLNLKEQGALQNKYTPDSDRAFSYPLNLDTDFEFVAGEYDKHANLGEAERADLISKKDIALVHIDGNGLGIILRKLDAALEGVSASEYAKAFRSFSESLAKATQTAAKEATKIVIEHGLYNQNTLAMRPLVLGGDDVTLLIRADLAIEWSEAFCNAFKSASKSELRQTIKLIKKNKELGKDIKEYLTASGGILFQKSGHPFTNSHDLVEGLCKKAKALTKSIDKNVGPAALSFLRLSNTATQDIDAVISQNFEVEAGHLGTLSTGLGAYLIEPDGKYASLSELKELYRLCKHQNTPMTLGKWREILTHLSLGNINEANKVVERALTLNQKGKTSLEQAFVNISKQETSNFWYWQSDEQYVTPLSDLMVLERFSFKAQSQEKECAE